MVLNVSGRTDIVAFYSKWFMNCYYRGYLLVRNPIYPKLVSKINFSDVDLIVFCTKNPKPILKYLQDIHHPIIFQVTLTPYKKDIEPNVPDKKEIIANIKELSHLLGKENVYVRYDPIFLSQKYPLEYHLKAFARICSLLEGYITKIIISFIDDYKNVRQNMNILRVKNFTAEDFKIIGTEFSKIASSHNLTVQTCSEYNNLSSYGFQVDDCVSKSLVKSLTGKSFPKWQARNNKYCGCIKMVDIGSYNTCPHMCKYCYANFNEEKVQKLYKIHDPDSPLLIGTLQENDEIKVRTK